MDFSFVVVLLYVKFNNITKRQTHYITLHFFHKISFPEKFTKIDDIDGKNSHIDVGTKSTYPMMATLKDDLNFTWVLDFQLPL